MTGLPLGPFSPQQPNQSLLAVQSEKGMVRDVFMSVTIGGMASRLAVLFLLSCCDA